MGIMCYFMENNLSLSTLPATQIVNIFSKKYESLLQNLPFFLFH